MNDMSPLVSIDWLATHLSAPDIRLVDASWYLPADGRTPPEEYRGCHIPGAVFFDLDEIADLDSGLPHMLPSAEKFAARVRKLGLGDGNRLVIYDGGDPYAAARVRWMFRAFGASDVVVLDGGLMAWQAAGKAIDDIPPVPRERHFSARLQHPMVRDKTQMLANIDSGNEQVIDARCAARYRGEAEEPRPGLRKGHMPGAINIPYTTVFSDTGTYKPVDALKKLFADAGVDMAKAVTVYCGSGVTACTVGLALEAAGHRRVAVYDGSWAEWGADPDVPITTAA